jgi:rhodanese-related sulfurtransferase
MKRILMLILATALVAFANPDGLSRLITEKSEAYILVDVRTPEEYSSGHIPTAVNIPVSTIAMNLPTEDRSALIIVYCASGRRSAVAKKTLDGLRFIRVVDFGGISRWAGELVF